mmetsp:Transcript_21822/g.49409  ORF Transcript_21822/g.49409 Transcript_21822/m.49409 type:complete len:84 (-) Transcript_21822:499-750(-)
MMIRNSVSDLECRCKKRIELRVRVTLLVAIFIHQFVNEVLYSTKNRLPNPHHPFWGGQQNANFIKALLLEIFWIQAARFPEVF